MSNVTVLHHNRHNVPGFASRAEKLRAAAERNGADLAVVTRQLQEAARLEDQGEREARVTYLLGVQRQILDSVERSFNTYGKSLVESWGRVDPDSLPAEAKPKWAHVRGRIDEVAATHVFFETYRTNTQE